MATPGFLAAGKRTSVPLELCLVVDTRHGGREPKPPQNPIARIGVVACRGVGWKPEGHGDVRLHSGGCAAGLAPDPPPILPENALRSLVPASFSHAAHTAQRDLEPVGRLHAGRRAHHADQGATYHPWNGGKLEPGHAVLAIAQRRAHRPDQQPDADQGEQQSEKRGRLFFLDGSTYPEEAAPPAPSSFAARPVRG